jgi:hypothetical protein
MAFFHNIFISYFLLLHHQTCSNIFIVKRFKANFKYSGADKSLARPTSRCILFGGENISFGVSLVICINSINVCPILIINRIHEHQNLLSL